MLKRIVLLLGLAALAVGPAWADCNLATNCYRMNDGTGVMKGVNALVLPDAKIQQMTTPGDATGAPYSSANPLPVAGPIFNTLDADVKAVQPRSIAANAPRTVQTGNLAAVNDAITTAVDGMNAGVVQLSAGWTGTVVFEGSADNGATWAPVTMVPFAGGAGSSSTSAGGLWEAAIGGLTNIRARASTTITGGPAVGLVAASNGLKSLRVGAPDANPVPVKGAPVTYTQTVVALAANSPGQLIGSNPSRKSLRWMDVGTNPMTVVPGAGTPVVGSGMNYNGGNGSGQQGSSEQFDAGAVPTNAFQAISAAGTTAIVWEGL